MQKQINPSTKAHLLRGAFYLLLLLAVFVIPFAVAQRVTVKRGTPKQNVPAPQLPHDLRAFPGLPASQYPKTSSAPSGVCNVIVNGGFETGGFTGWAIDGANATPVVTNTLSHSGTYSAFAGDAPDGFCGPHNHEATGDSAFYQEFTVPAGGGILSFWHWDCTTDVITFDWQDAYITDTNGTILQTIFHQCSNLQAWIQQTVDMTPYAGQTVHIKFLVHEDGFGDLTGMYVDDVSLLCGPTPTPTPTPTPSCTPGELIDNGGFETGSFSPGWFNYLGRVTDTLSHSGTYSAFIGGAGNPPDSFCGKGQTVPADSRFYQVFAVPAAGGTLSFWHWDCTTGNITSEWQDAYITDQTGVNILETIFHQCNNTQQWVQTTVDVTPFAGKLVAIKFLVHQDGSNNVTGMYVDDVSLPVGCASSCGLVVGDGLAIGYGPNNYTTLASNIVNYTFVNSHQAQNNYAIFQTHNPWGRTFLEDAIFVNGHTASIFTPAQLAGFDFSQYRVIVLDWDDTFTSDFLTLYAAAIPGLEAYASAGGVVWVQGAIQGSIGDCYPLPFGGQSCIDSSSSDFILDPSSPMVQGVPNPITGSPASLVSDSGLPGNAHVVVTKTDANGPPVLYDLRLATNCAPSPTPTATATITATPTPTATSTPRPTPTPRSTPPARPRPTPAPRPTP